MTVIKSIPQSPREDDNSAVTSRMNISFLLTAANAAEDLDEKHKFKLEPTSEHSPTTCFHECDEMKWQPTPPNSSQSSPSSNFKLDINIRLPPIRLSTLESEQEERQLNTFPTVVDSNLHDIKQEHQLAQFPQQQEFQLPAFRTIENSTLHDLEQDRQRLSNELTTHWNRTTFPNESIPYPQNGSLLADFQLRLQQLQQQNSDRLRAGRLTQDYDSRPDLDVPVPQTDRKQHLPSSRAQRLPRPGRRHPRTSRHRPLTTSTTTSWNLPIPIHTSHPQHGFRRPLAAPYAHPHLHAQAPLISTQDATTYYETQYSPSLSLARTTANPAAPSNSPPAPHSNKAYPLEQVDWIRYQKDDCAISWSEMLKMFHVRFPENRLSDQCLSSRYYRDNRVPVVEWVDGFGGVFSSSSALDGQLVGSGELVGVQKSDGGMIGGGMGIGTGVGVIEGRVPRLVRDEKGRIKWMAAKVRDRASEEGKKLGIPFHLVDKHPERAVAYAWVREEHKVLARGVLEGRDTGDVFWAKKAEWRRILRMVEWEEQQSSAGAAEVLTQENMHMHIEM